MKLIYICSGDVSVYESQVLELLQYYIVEKKMELVLLQGYTSTTSRRALERKIANYPALEKCIIWHRSYPDYPFLEPLKLAVIRKALLTIPRLSEYTLHARSEMTGYLVQKVLRQLGLTNKLVVDFRAIVLEELRYKTEKNKTRGLRKFLSRLQIRYWQSFYHYFFAQRDSNLIISSVSSIINQYIQERYPSCVYRLTVHPNVAGRQFVYTERGRREVRQTLGIPLDAHVAICATGSNALWQKDEDTIETLVREGVYVINLSNHKIDIPGCITTKVPFAKMPAYLSAADMAVLWREESLINWSASPSKLSEFATMGLWIIHNNTVANAVDYIQKTGAGILVDRVEEIQTDSYTDNREARIRSGQHTFSVEAIAESYISLYQ